MNRLPEILVANAVLVAALAVLLVAAGRLPFLRNRPAARQVLWMLLLAKLCLPPLYAPKELAIPWSFGGGAKPDGSRFDRHEGPVADSQFADSQFAVLRPTRNPDSRIFHGRSFEAPAGRPAAAVFEERELATANLSTPHDNIQREPTIQRESKIQRESTFGANRPRRGMAFEAPWPASWMHALRSRVAAPAAVAWGAVSCWLALRLVRQSRRVRHTLRMAADAPPALVERLARLAERAGVRGCPRLLVADGRFSPFLWAPPGGATIVIPKAFLAPSDIGGMASGKLDANRLDFVLAHELAHCRRWDPWTNLFVSAICTLFWFHPAVWLARREIRDAQEACCDALVMSLFPAEPGARRHYAQTLLATVDFVSAETAMAPAWASEFGGVRSLRRRIEMLANTRLSPGWSRSSSLAVAFAVALIPFGVTLGRPATGQDQQAQEQAANDPQPANESPPESNSLPSEYKVDLPDATSQNQSDGDGADLQTGESYRFLMQNGDQVVGQVVRQKGKWKQLQAQSGESIAINLDHVQSFQRNAPRQAAANDRAQARAAANKRPDPKGVASGAAVRIPIAIDAEGRIRVRGEPIPDDFAFSRVMQELAAKHADKPLAIELTADPAAAADRVQQVIGQAFTCGVRIVGLKTADPANRARAKNADVGEAESERVKDILRAELARRLAHQQEQEALQSLDVARKLAEDRAAEERKARAAAEAALAEQTALRRQAEAQASLKDELAKASEIIELLRAELTANIEELKHARREIEKLKQLQESQDRSKDPFDAGKKKAADEESDAEGEALSNKPRLDPLDKADQEPAKATRP